MYLGFYTFCHFRLDDAYKKAKELEEKEGYVFVHPFNDEDVLDGQGTIALEILEELPETDIILVPIGGGGLISGIACAAKILKPEIKIIGVEPEGAASAYEAIKENKVVELKEANTWAAARWPSAPPSTPPCRARPPT